MLPIDPGKRASAQAPGVTKQQVVEWIQESERFRTWVDIMQSKLEPKSYQVSISKAMQKAGYERSTSVSVGRHVRWYLPADLCPRDATAVETSQNGDKDVGTTTSSSKVEPQTPVGKGDGGGTSVTAEPSQASPISMPTSA